jgi:hypothetical protein
VVATTDEDGNDGIHRGQRRASVQLLLVCSRGGSLITEATHWPVQVSRQRCSEQRQGDEGGCALQAHSALVEESSATVEEEEEGGAQGKREQACIRV